MTLDELEGIVQVFDESEENWSAAYLIKTMRVKELIAVVKAARNLECIPTGLTAAVAIQTYLESQTYNLRKAFKELEKPNDQSKKY